MQMPLGDPRGKLLPRLIHQLAIRGEISQPQSVYARAFDVERAGIQWSALSGGRAIRDDAAEVAQAANAFRDVLAAQHFEDGVDAFAVGDFFDRVFVVALFVIDAMLQ